MTAGIYYLVAVVAAVITTVVFTSRASQQAKAGLIGISLVALVCMCVMGAAVHWAHVPGLLATYVVSARLTGLLYKVKTNHKHGR